VARRVRILAPAKVNLTLEVLGRRADGYHDLASVMATIDLHDDVRVAPSRTLDVRIRPDVGAPPGEDLATRAVRALARASGREPRAHVSVRKRIPVAAGLGGGSSDAAAVLRALAALWRVDVDLASLAATIGSDVPFFAAGVPVARVGGRGERVEALPPIAELWVVLVTLARRVPTAAVFAARGEDERSDGGSTEHVAALLRDGRVRPADLRSHSRNDLLPAAERTCPEIREARALAARSGITLFLSGSGPSLFAIADDRAHALRLTRLLRRAGLRARPLRAATAGERTRAPSP